MPSARFSDNATKDGKMAIRKNTMPSSAIDHSIE